MPETRRRYDADFRAGAVQMVRETKKPIAEIARQLGIHDGTLGNWVAKDRKARGEEGAALEESERAELMRLRKENVELRMAVDVLKRATVLWVEEATR